MIACHLLRFIYLIPAIIFHVIFEIFLNVCYNTNIMQNCHNLIVMS